MRGDSHGETRAAETAASVRQRGEVSVALLRGRAAGWARARSRAGSRGLLLLCQGLGGAPASQGVVVPCAWDRWLWLLLGRGWWERKGMWCGQEQQSPGFGGCGGGGQVCGAQEGLRKSCSGGPSAWAMGSARGC